MKVRERTLIAIFVFPSFLIFLRMFDFSLSMQQPTFDVPMDCHVETGVNVDALQCGFEDDFLIQLYKGRETQRTRVTLVSEFFIASNHSIDAIHANLRDNSHHARFIYLIGDSRKSLRTLLEIVQLRTNMEVYYAPGGVTYRHLFASAVLYPETFVIHNADIAVGNLTRLLDACNVENSFDDAVVVGSRVDALREGAHCTEYSSQGSFDTYITNRKHFDCAFLNNMRFAPFYWGAENVVASQLPKKRLANLCPHWKFAHYHPGKGVASQKSGERAHRIRINQEKNTWKRHKSSARNDEVLSEICDLELLK